MSLANNTKGLYQTVAKNIVQRIRSGVYPVGSRLPGERHLAKELGVSRITIRHAEILLQARGEVDIKIGSGVYVLDAAEQRHGYLPEVSAFEVTEARSLFESEVAALAALNIGEEDLAQLAEYVERMATDDPEDEEAAEQADRDFHLMIAAASGNSAVRHVVETLWKMRMEIPQVKEVYDAVCFEDSAQRRDEHAEILYALRDRDSVASRAAMRRHFTRLLESMLDVTEEQALAQIRERALESRQRFLKTARI